MPSPQMPVHLANTVAPRESRKACGLHKPIVFLGPSLSWEAARSILDADYRPPVRRGDLQAIEAGQVVGIIDGVFDQQLAVTPTEIREALERGALIFGASSMGALRAVEVPGVVGVGRVFEMYRDGSIDCDDEVAVIFDPETLVALCEPLVNIRHSLDRLSSSGTLSRTAAQRLLRSARALPYFKRTYSDVLTHAGLADRPEAAQLARMLAEHDLKRDDALLLLEYLQRAIPEPSRATGTQTADTLPPHHTIRPSASSLHLWEFGPPIAFHEVVCFLAMTGALRPHAIRTASGIEIDEQTAAEIAGNSAFGSLADAVWARTARCWNWMTDEEVATTLRQLSLDEPSLRQAATRIALGEAHAKALLRRRDTAFLDALRGDLFFRDLELKRQGARASSLRWLADRHRNGRKLSAAERAAARSTLCRIVDTRNWPAATAELAAWGVPDHAVLEFVDDLAFAQRSAHTVPAPAKPRMRLPASPKISGSLRFCMSIGQAASIARCLQSVIGITRVADITGLSTLGLPNAQAFRPDGQWSSTVGSGKSETRAGARIGAVMEEVEKWAQERFTSEFDLHVAVTASFTELRRRNRPAVDPASLDLPWDSVYRANLELPWIPARDLVAGGTRLIPAAAVTHSRLPHDICYSPFGARKTVTTNGLASGMTVAEALTHALCECIERHHRALDSIVHDNPGSPWPMRRACIDLAHAPASTRRILRRFQRAGCRVVARSIAFDIAVPTFVATIVRPDGSPDGTHFGDGWQEASGWASHPDPETALNMALLEASQTILTHIAGAREDLTLAARSLGRHERTQSVRFPNLVPEFDDGAVRVAHDVVPGLCADDAAADVRWVVGQLMQAGFNEVLSVDYSRPEISPAQVVRCVIPGLETINPFHTGVRARRALLADLLVQR